MIIRCGLPKDTGMLPRVAAEQGYDCLISAGALWDKHRKRFRQPGAGIYQLKSVALDSAGFVAMKHHGGYPWTVAEYVAMVATHRRGHAWPWAWWSSMDLCCEPEIAGQPEVVAERVQRTAELLRECRAEADLWEIPPPMPILQGWHPADYVESIRLQGEVLGGVWPDLVGIGSVCRRNVNGPTGLFAVLRAVSAALPAHVRFHLFGVKGDAIPDLAQNPRVLSTDSCAWDSGARADLWQRRKASGLPPREANRVIPASVAHSAACMVRWMERPTVEAPQLRLFVP